MRVGDYLRQNREEKKISLDTVSYKTKIAAKSLVALESNRFDQLPSRVYIIAYVKNYCRSIQLDSTKPLELLEEEFQTSTQEQEEVNEESLPTVANSGSGASELFSIIIQKLSDKKIIFTAIAFILVVSLSYKIKSIVDQKLPSTTDDAVESVEEIAESDTNEITNDDKEELAKVIAKEEKPAVKAEPVKVAEPKKVEVKKEEPKKVEPKVEEVKEVIVKKEEPEEDKKEDSNEDSRFKPIRNQMYVLDPNASEVNDQDIYPLTYKNRVNLDKHNVFINALFSDVWYRYQLDNGAVKQNTLKQGTKVFLQADNSILVFLGNFFATKVIYNNSLVNGKAPAGVKSLIFPHEKRTEYFLPLFTKDKDGKAVTSKEFMEAKSN